MCADKLFSYMADDVAASYGLETFTYSFHIHFSLTSWQGECLRTRLLLIYSFFPPPLQNLSQ